MDEKVCLYILENICFNNKYFNTYEKIAKNVALHYPELKKSGQVESYIRSAIKYGQDLKILKRNGLPFVTEPDKNDGDKKAEDKKINKNIVDKKIVDKKIDDKKNDVKNRMVKKVVTISTRSTNPDKEHKTILSKPKLEPKNKSSTKSKINNNCDVDEDDDEEDDDDDDDEYEDEDEDDLSEWESESDQKHTFKWVNSSRPLNRKRLAKNKIVKKPVRYHPYKR